MSHILDKESIVPTCVKLCSVALKHLLTVTNMAPESEDWIGGIKSSLKFLKEIVSVSDADSKFKYSGNANRELALHLIPLGSLLEYGLTADNIEINQLTLTIIGVFHSGD